MIKLKWFIHEEVNHRRRKLSICQQANFLIYPYSIRKSGLSIAQLFFPDAVCEEATGSSVRPQEIFSVYT